MNKFILLLGVLLVLTSCSSTKETASENKENVNENVQNIPYFEKQVRGVNFCAKGSEPNWELEIDYDKIVSLKSEDKNINFNVNILKFGEGLKRSEAVQQVKNMDGELTITIKKNEDYFSNIENNKPFVVEVNYKNTKNNKEEVFKGEGLFYGDIRLHDIWILESINGKEINTANLRKQPYMEIHLNDNKVMGFLGCNNFSTSVYCGRNEITFHHLMSTKMACLNSDIEPRFSKAISGKTLSYQLEDLALILKNDKDMLVFRKGD